MATPLAANFTRLTSADLLKFKRYLVSNVNRALEGDPLPAAERDALLKQQLEEAYVQTKVNLPNDLRQQIFQEILDELTGFGPLQTLLDDPDVSEVMVNGPKKIYVEKGGKLLKTPVTFDDDDHVLRIID